MKHCLKYALYVSAAAANIARRAGRTLSIASAVPVHPAMQKAFRCSAGEATTGAACRSEVAFHRSSVRPTSSSGSTAAWPG